MNPPCHFVTSPLYKGGKVDGRDGHPLYKGARWMDDKRRSADLEGKYPIRVNGENIGTLEVSREGAYTLFRADCGMMQGIIRLSVYGGDKEGYLGVPAPVEGRLRLKKRLSRAAMRDFPQSIEEVGIAGRQAESVEAQDCFTAEDMPGEAESAGQPCGEDKDESGDGEQDCSDMGPFWYASPDGALVGMDRGREMVALPVDDGRVPRNITGESRIIEGREYLVYITKEVK